MKGFFNKVYAVVEKIPQGKVMTYGQIAAVLGCPENARVVGWAMRAAPKSRNLPCHRVVNRKGEMSPNHVFGAAEIQRALLESEGIKMDHNGCIDLKEHLWDASAF